jgi:hypothetical protein
MTTRLTDNERSLLSAYRDGEVSGGEKAQAERLLEASQEAREYLHDLRSLNQISNAVFPAVSASAVGVGMGSKLTSSAIQSAAHGATHTGASIGWGWIGLAAAAATTVAVLTATLGDDDASSAPRAAVSAPTVGVTPAGLEVDSSALLVPAITNQELIDFAMTGQLPIDSSRECYLTVAPKQGELAIEVHTAPKSVSAELQRIDLGAVPGIDSIERAIRTSLLQSSGKGIAVRADLPTLRLRVLAELEESDDLPADVRRAMSSTRVELEREYQRMSGELRSSRLSARRDRDASGQTRYLVIAGTDLQKSASAPGSPAALTFSIDDDRIQTIDVSKSELRDLAARVEAPRTIDAQRPVETPRSAVASRPSESRVRFVTSGAPRGATRRATNSRSADAQQTVAPSAPDSAASISFEEVQQMQQRNQTLDGYYSRTEHWLIRAERILQRADSIRVMIRRMRETTPPADSGAQAEDGDQMDTDGAN